jgi:UDP-N-acetyl-D-mannosaminuronate dehydrogenase
LQDSDLVLLVTDHTVYDFAWIASQAWLIVDNRNAFNGIVGEHIYRA